MNSVKVYIVTEGQTEQTFIREVLAPELANQNIYLIPTLIGTPGHKGGYVNIKRAKQDIGNFLKQQSDTFISSMFDYFRLDENWPGMEEIKQRQKNGMSMSAIEKAEILEKATLENFTDTFPKYNTSKRFIPYFEMHEFEALLFSDAAILAKNSGINITEIKSILNQYDNNPEEINDNPAKAPSKRLITLSKSYRKVVMGKTISEAIGIQTIRKQSKHFDEWLIKIENIPITQTAL